VAILSDSGFDATIVDPLSVTLASAQVRREHERPDTQDDGHDSDPRRLDGFRSALQGQRLGAHRAVKAV
jgi:hypothetical protein